MTKNNEVKFEGGQPGGSAGTDQPGGSTAEEDKKRQQQRRNMGEGNDSEQAY